jgi:hypothetical protein
MDYLFRFPRFPVVIDTGESLIHAKSRAHLETKLAKITFADEAKLDIIDSNAEGFALYPKTMLVTPIIGIRRWTKVQIIDLYNSKKKPGAPQLRSTSLGSRSLERIVSEVVELLSQTS